PPPTIPAKPDTVGQNCPCPTPGGSSTIVTPGSSTTASPTQPNQADTLRVQPPRFSPDGGSFYMSTNVKLTADSLPPQALIEYSADNGETWQTGSQFTLTKGGKILTRIRAGTRLSRNREATFSIYFKRMLIIGNSIMSHGPAPELGWYNHNGMAASAPEKDFVHLLTGYFQQIYPAMTMRLQAGTGLEQKFGTPNYSVDEFNRAMQEFKPDLIIVRLGENVDDGQVLNRNFELHFRQLLDRLVSYDQSVRIICTTSVWYKPNFDAVVRKVTPERGCTLVDLGSMVGQAQCFASQYANPGVAAHPNDTGMRYIADMIWRKIQ
ncbi:SGNH/GDSL hydrolase family protein, partial [Spirosoma sp.]|uniref:SGNH/GDSL hydrolase family protein n=1 Tax=Spirosoma sp. TaxID=1899569 RepID=UPI003B3A4546